MCGHNEELGAPTTASYKARTQTRSVRQPSLKEGAEPVRPQSVQPERAQLDWHRLVGLKRRQLLLAVQVTTLLLVQATMLQEVQVTTPEVGGVSLCASPQAKESPSKLELFGTSSCVLFRSPECVPVWSGF